MKNNIRKVRSFIKRNAFRLIEKHLGIHITSAHFHSPIPNVGELKPEVFTSKNQCVGLDFCVDAQLSYLQSVFPRYLNEYSPPINPGLSQVDAFVLYATIRTKKPKLLIEIGSGESTKIGLAAMAKNASEGIAGHFTGIEPFPRKFLRDIKTKDFRLVESKVQDVDIEFFSQVDLLFIDSSHVAKIGSDVNYEILDIIPRLKVGALIHWHDIMIPMDYSRAWIESGDKFWNESYIVHAFMLFNRCFEVRWASRFMQITYADQLARIFPYFNPTDPNQQLSSFWIERVS